MNVGLASICLMPPAGRSASAAPRARGGSGARAVIRASDAGRAKAVRKLQHPVRARKLEGFLDV